MKHLVRIALLSVIGLRVVAQNVGINTQLPQATLDVRGSLRSGGQNNYMVIDSANGRIEWTGLSLFTPVSQQIIRHSASAEGLYAGGGKLEYRNQVGEPVFFSNWTNGEGYFAGNVGIGTATPLARLHVFKGASGADAGVFSPLVVENSENTYLNLLSPAANESGLLFGRPGNEAQGGIIYNNATTPDGFQFRNNGNQVKVVIDYSGRLGIGTTTPLAPLSINTNAGDKISLWSDGTSTYYGLGVQAALMQIFTKTSGDDIAFGYGNSINMTENMRIRGNGMVGMGNANPAYRLDITGRMRIRSGGDNSQSAGLWLNNNVNTEASFIGMEDDQHVGFYGIQSGWRFSMNTTTGALKINGTEGLQGQILQSNGSQAPEWRSNPVSDMFNMTEELACTAEVIIPAQSTGDVPGLSKTLVLTKTSKVVVQFTVLANSIGCTFCGGTTFDMIINLDGGNTGRVRYAVPNGENLHVTGSRIFLLQPGTHTIKISGNTLSGPNLRLGLPPGVYPSFMTLQVIPQD